MKRIKCEQCDKQFKTRKQLRNHKANSHNKVVTTTKRPNKNIKKIKNWGIAIAILLLVGWGISQIGGNAGGPKLPPTSAQGHVEQSPVSHVLKTPMPEAVQRHMLEHSDGDGPSGVIINYDCINYDCEPDLVSKLEAFANKYPDNVYVAPFKNMKVKIALTKLGRIDKLDKYDEQRIESFIN